MKISYNKFKKIFLNVAENFVEQYDIDENNKDAIKIILTYFAGIDTPNYPLTKGILVRGFKGSGKTITFKIIQKIIRNFAINNCRDVVADYNIGGFDAIDSYIKLKTRLFDDLGKEDIGKYYGNSNDVFRDIILRRYESFQNSGLITHFTTNESNQQLLDRYDEWAYDRLKAMCSVIVLGKKDLSRRDKYRPIDKNKKSEHNLSKDEIDALNLTSVKNISQKIIIGDDTLYNSMYVQVYDWLKRHDKINLSDNLRLEITTEAEQMILSDRQHEIDKLTHKGNLTEVVKLNKKMYDIEPDLMFYQKKIAIIRFIQDKHEMGISIDEIFNINKDER